MGYEARVRMEIPLNMKVAKDKKAIKAFEDSTNICKNWEIVI